MLRASQSTTGESVTMAAAGVHQDAIDLESIDFDRVIVDADYRRSVIECLKRAERAGDVRGAATSRAASDQSPVQGNS